MINLIINSVAKKLHDDFNVSVITDDLSQNLPMPCFFVKCLNVSKSELLSDRYILNIPLDIIYITLEKKNIINNVIISLMNNYKFVDLYDSDLNKVGVARGFNVSSEIIDNEMHFFITYKIVLNNIEQLNNEMETVGISIDA